MTEMGLDAADARPTRRSSVMGKTFDPAKPDDYVDELRDQEGIVTIATIARAAYARLSCGATACSLQLYRVLGSCSSCALLGAWHLATRGTRPVAADGSGIRQADGRDRDAGQIGDARPARRRRQALGAPASTRSTTTARTTRASASSSPIRSRASALGYLLAVLVAVPIGFLIGMSPLMSRALDPFIQMLKPISPLAWMPLALYTIKDSGAVGDLRDLHLLAVADADQHRVRRRRRCASEWLNVARTLEVGAVAPRLHRHPAGGGADDPDRHAHLDRHRLAGDRRRRDAGRRHRHRLLRLERMEQPVDHQRDHRDPADRPGRHAARPDAGAPPPRWSTFPE